jgi:hypothetical protein
MLYIISVAPFETTVTVPPLVIVATAVLLLLQVPPVGELVSVTTSPVQRFKLPVIGDGGNGLMVTARVL